MSLKLSDKKKMKNLLFFYFFIFSCLLVRIGIIQMVDGKWLSELAYEQQTINRGINAKRGTIYDATGEKVLAISSTVETITINPNNIKKENKEKVALALSQIFELDYESMLTKVNRNSSSETIIKRVEKEKTDELRIWMVENNIEYGINIDEDTKRYYPYSNFASQVIGFVGSDNQGLDGIEAWYDSELKGEKGYIVKQTDARGYEIGDEGETYVPAISGNDLVLTIDYTIQSIVEKYLKEACIDNVCTDGGSIIAMNPQNGDILAMANYPSYDLNNPYNAYTEELELVWDTMESSQKTTMLQSVWRNKSVSDTYEPGSTFKIITAAVALEEGITEVDKAGEFNCGGSINIAGVNIKCWRYYNPHGSQSLREALMNSCNPVFIGLGQQIGKNTYYKYLQEFGLLEKTGIDIPGEAGSIFLAEEKVGPVELATISFGQRFEITPIQLVTAVSSMVNGGNLVEPRVVKQIIDSQTNEIVDIPVESTKVNISDTTSQSILSMLHSVVSEGTAKNAQVLGYEIGGKTGTSEDGVNTNKYVTSFIGVASIQNPEIVLLITLYNPTGEGGHQGGGVAAPVAGQIFSEVLPYMEIENNNQNEVQTIIVPDIIGLSVEEAEKILIESGLILVNENELDIEQKKETLVTNQIPKKGITVNKGTNVYIN